MKKLFLFQLMLGLILLSSCEKKIDLSTEVFDIKTYQSTIEKAFADSADKTDQQILISFINDNLEGKVSQTLKENDVFAPVFAEFKSDLESDKSTPRLYPLTYEYILENARIYTTWLKKFNEFNETLTKTLNVKFLKFSPKRYSDWKILNFEAQNNGALEIVEIKFTFYIYNKSGEEILAGELSSDELTIAQGATNEFEIEYWNRKLRDYDFSDEVKKIANMDLSALNFVIYIKEISFKDGSILAAPILSQ